MTNTTETPKLKINYGKIITDELFDSYDSYTLLSLCELTIPGKNIIKSCLGDAKKFKEVITSFHASESSELFNNTFSYDDIIKITEKDCINIFKIINHDLKEFLIPVSYELNIEDLE